LVLVLLTVAGMAAMGTLDELGAWERHHNVMSWYIRVLFLLPFCYFAYKRSLFSIVLTLVALATSMFWFPAPARPDPKAIEFLAMEREYLAGEWTTTKILLGLLVPGSLVALAVVFWKRSVVYGLVLINDIVLVKLAWSFYFGDMLGGLTLLPSQLVGFVILNAAVLYVLHRRNKRSSSRPAPRASMRAHRHPDARRHQPLPWPLPRRCGLREGVLAAGRCVRCGSDSPGVRVRAEPLAAAFGGGRPTTGAIRGGLRHVHEP